MIALENLLTVDEVVDLTAMHHHEVRKQFDAGRLHGYRDNGDTGYERLIPVESLASFYVERDEPVPILVEQLRK